MPYKRREKTPGNRSIQGTNREQVKHGDAQAEKAKDGQYRVDGLKSRVSEYLNPSQKWHGHNCLRDDTTPGNDTLVVLRIWLAKSRDSPDRIQLDGPNGTSLALCRNQVTALVNQNDPVVGKENRARQERFLERTGHNDRTDEEYRPMGKYLNPPNLHHFEEFVKFCEAHSLDCGFHRARYDAQLVPNSIRPHCSLFEAGSAVRV